MSVLNLATIEAARERLRGVAVRTPLLRLGGLPEHEIWIKPEVFQPIGSFKLRGAYNALSQMMEQNPVDIGVYDQHRQYVSGGCMVRRSLRDSGEGDHARRRASDEDRCHPRIRGKR